MRSTAVVPVLFALLWLAPTLTFAQGDGRSRRSSNGSSAKKPQGTVLTFYGLRKLENDPDVREDEKLREWEAFIERGKKQLAYAQRAVKRWKVAARRRIVEDARTFDRDTERTAVEKIERWSTVADLYPRTADARTARRRITHWTTQETKRLIRRAEKIERRGRSKLKRIKAWARVLIWAKRGPEAKAAQRRIRVLQDELYKDARSVDRLARADPQTKLDAWRSVLDGRPTRAQKSTARRRVRALQSQLSAE